MGEQIKDYYLILEISINATEEDIKRAFRKLAVKYHPDKNQGDDYFTKKFIEIKEAYDVLSDANKRVEYDILYKQYFNQQSESERKEYNFQQAEKKKKEQEQDEKYYYEPFKPFYSNRDRELQDTPQYNPIFDLLGNKIPDNIDFFILPKRIGKLIGGFSDFIKGSEPSTAKQKRIWTLKCLGVAVLLSLLIILLGKPNEIWTVIWAVAPALLALFFAKAGNVFLHKNYFVGVNGFAEYECRDNKTNLTENIEVNFNDVTDLYVYQVERRLNYSYQGTDFLYMFLDTRTDKIPYAKEGSYNKKDDFKNQPVDLIFCRRIEQYWTIYLLDKMESILQEKGYVPFNIYIKDKNIYAPYIKLGIGYITFIKSDTDEFTYKFNEIKRMYSKGSELHIEHNNFQKKMFFFKSGNEDVIPMLHLCNRQFFYKAMELLLGYRIN
ncbi:DnaJ domain-containing protein [Alistipes sp. OttesenSCG-928-B03]|nr:DnaJ domain-containing protein [Alistipes sp. OttesenSCG-928-B03]